MIRAASDPDLDYLLRAYVDLGRHTKAVADNPFVDEMPDEPGPATIELARRHLDDPDGFALIAELDGQPAGCACGWIGAASAPWSRRRVATLALCWVEHHRRGRGLGRALATAVEELARERGVDVIELSYVAGNDEAAQAWAAMGYRPHRVFAYREIGARPIGEASPELAAARRS